MTEVSRWNGPALTLVENSVHHDEDSWYLVRELVIGFVNQEYDGGCLRVVCEGIESEVGKQSLRRQCERYLQFGITQKEHDHLENRLWMTASEIRHYSDKLTDVELYYWERYGDVPGSESADPATDQPWLEANLAILPPVEWSMTLDDEELVEPQEDREDEAELPKRMPRLGAPTNLKDLSPLEALRALIEWDVCSEDAVYGLVAHFLDCDYNDAMIEVLCKHIDSLGDCDKFARYIAMKKEAQVTHGWQTLGF